MNCIEFLVTTLTPLPPSPLLTSFSPPLLSLPPPLFFLFLPPLLTSSSPPSSPLSPPPLLSLPPPPPHLFLPPPQCDADPAVTKVAVQEDKYENVLTLITYYQMVLTHTNTYHNCIHGFAKAVYRPCIVLLDAKFS